MASQSPSGDQAGTPPWREASSTAAVDAPAAALEPTPPPRPPRPPRPADDVGVLSEGTSDTQTADPTPGRTA
jgi:hypothetical protein